MLVNDNLGRKRERLTPLRESRVYAGFVVRVSPGIGYALQSLTFIADIGITDVCARPTRDGILVSAKISETHCPVQSAVDGVFHGAADGCVRLSVFLDQLRTPVRIWAADVFD